LRVLFRRGNLGRTYLLRRQEEIPEHGPSAR
jgi:hypothetical protein